jgi:hypothetical protein
MTKAQEEVITSVQRRRRGRVPRRSGLLQRRWSRAQLFRGCPCSRDSHQSVYLLSVLQRNETIINALSCRELLQHAKAVAEPTARTK